eukprot:1918394-Rhodomonas_salina.3
MVAWSHSRRCLASKPGILVDVFQCLKHHDDHDDEPRASNRFKLCWFSAAKFELTNLVFVAHIEHPSPKLEQIMHHVRGQLYHVTPSMSG